MRHCLAFFLALVLLLAPCTLAHALPVGTLTAQNMPQLRAAALASATGSALEGGFRANTPISLEGRAHLLMTAYLALRELEPGAVFSVGNAITELPEHSVRAGLDVGNQLSVRAAAALMLADGAQDAALAFAQLFSGGSQEFVALLNATAAELGMESTRFTNATGAFDSDQYTTAQDLLRLVAVARENETLRALLDTPRLALNAPRSSLPAAIENPLAESDAAFGLVDARVRLLFAYDSVYVGETLILLEGAFGGEEPCLAAVRLRTRLDNAADSLTALLEHWDGGTLSEFVPPVAPPVATSISTAAPIAAPSVVVPASAPAAPAFVPSVSAAGSAVSSAQISSSHTPAASAAPAKIVPAPVYEPLPASEPQGLMARWGWALWLAAAALTAVGSWYFFRWLNNYFL